MRFSDEVIMKLSNDMVVDYLTKDNVTFKGENWRHAFVVQHLSGNIIDIFRNSKENMSTFGIPMENIFVLIIYETVKDSIETL